MFVGPHSLPIADTQIILSRILCLLYDFLIPLILFYFIVLYYFIL